MYIYSIHCNLRVKLWEANNWIMSQKVECNFLWCTYAQSLQVGVIFRSINRKLKSLIQRLSIRYKSRTRRRQKAKANRLTEVKSSLTHTYKLGAKRCPTWKLEIANKLRGIQRAKDKMWLHSSLAIIVGHSLWLSYTNTHTQTDRQT